MTKPSREDFERVIAIMGGNPANIAHASRESALIHSALRIAADQMTEREKVVAWLDALSQEAKQKRSVDRRAFLEGLAIMIQRGDHSSAKPAGCR